MSVRISAIGGSASVDKLELLLSQSLRVRPHHRRAAHTRSQTGHSGAPTITPRPSPSQPMPGCCMQRSTGLTGRPQMRARLLRQSYLRNAKRAVPRAKQFKLHHHHVWTRFLTCFTRFTGFTGVRNTKSSLEKRPGRFGGAGSRRLPARWYFRWYAPSQHLPKPLIFLVADALMWLLPGRLLAHGRIVLFCWHRRR